MTKHRTKEEWINDIINAARLEIDENGYADFGMEAIARRAGLSKGGIYRFFSNRTHVALHLFSQCYIDMLSFDVAQCLCWNLPLQETVFGLLQRYNIPENEARRTDRIWIRLLPEVLNDQQFSDTRTKLLEEIAHKLTHLATLIATRDNIPLSSDFKVRFAEVFLTAAGLLEGFAVQSALGSSISYQGILVKTVLNELVHRLYD